MGRKKELQDGGKGRQGRERWEGEAGKETEEGRQEGMKKTTHVRGEDGGRRRRRQVRWSDGSDDDERTDNNEDDDVDDDCNDYDDGNNDVITIAMILRLGWQEVATMFEFPIVPRWHHRGVPALLRKRSLEV